MSLFAAYLNDESLLLVFVGIWSIDLVFYEFELILKTKNISQVATYFIGHDHFWGRNNYCLNLVL